MMIMLLESVGEVVDFIKIVVDELVEWVVLTTIFGSAVVGFPCTWLEIHPFRLQKSIKYALTPTKY